jgi:hypothetical protein
VGDAQLNSRACATEVSSEQQLLDIRGEYLLHSVEQSERKFFVNSALIFKEGHQFPDEIK